MTLLVPVHRNRGILTSLIPHTRPHYLPVEDAIVLQSSYIVIFCSFPIHNNIYRYSYEEFMQMF
jgi:hypothetical protein